LQPWLSSSKARSNRCSFSRNFSRRKLVEVVDVYSNESNFSAAEKKGLRLKNLLAVWGRFFSRNQPQKSHSAAEIRVC
jgi:hypothetical protein